MSDKPPLMLLANCEGKLGMNAARTMNEGGRCRSGLTGTGPWQVLVDCDRELAGD